MTFELRPFQNDALKILEKETHLICVAPTGSGKSLIYERFSQLRQCRTILFSPLVALARQQYEKISTQGIPVKLSLGDFEISNSGHALKSGIWIMSPEKLFGSPKTLENLNRWGPDFLVMDECHCLWDWGESFRPCFRQIPALIHSLSIRRSLWLTATLPWEARKFLRNLLPAENISELGEFDLPQRLHLQVKKIAWPDRPQALSEYLSSRKETGIIFGLTRQSTGRIQNIVAAAGKKSVVYHAGMSMEERRNIEALVRDQKTDVVIATSAFGMGMDFPHLNWAVLWQAPPSLLSLAQSIGRVGRSHIAGEAYVFWEEEDFRLLSWIGIQSSQRGKDLLSVLSFLKEKTCRRILLKKYFHPNALNASKTCKQCDVCTQ